MAPASWNRLQDARSTGAAVVPRDICAHEFAFAEIESFAFKNASGCATYFCKFGVNPPPLFLEACLGAVDAGLSIAKALGATLQLKQLQ